MKKTILLLMALSIYHPIFGQTTNEEYAEDVKSLDNIIDAYYAVVSGASTDPWQFERDSYIHSKNAVITRLDKNGVADSHTLAAEYIPVALAPKSDFYEKELKRTVSQFGNMAQVWSAFEIRTDPKTPSGIRGLNSLQLHYENGRWFIDSWTCEMESEGATVVKDFLSKD